MDWYRKLRPPRSRADRQRAVLKGSSLGLRERKPPKLRDPKHVFYRTYSTAVHINGYRAKAITRNGIAKLFDVPLTTVHRWDKAGALPEPFMIEQRGQQSVPLYLCSQIRCLMIVMHDLVNHGYVSIQWHNLDEFMTMLHEGYDEALRNFQKRLTHQPYGGLAGKHGVEFLD